MISVLAAWKLDAVVVAMKSKDVLPRSSLFPPTSRVNDRDGSEALGVGCRVSTTVYEPSESQKAARSASEKAEKVSGGREGSQVAARVVASSSRDNNWSQVAGSAIRRIRRSISDSRGLASVQTRRVTRTD